MVYFVSIWYGFIFIVNQKWKNKVFKLGKVNGRIQIIQLTNPGAKTPRYESKKMVLNQAQD